MVPVQARMCPGREWMRYGPGVHPSGYARSSNSRTFLSRSESGSIFPRAVCRIVSASWLHTEQPES